MEAKEKKEWIEPENSLNIKNLYIYQADAYNWVIVAKGSYKKAYYGTLTQAVEGAAYELLGTTFSTDLKEILINQKNLIEEIHALAQKHFKEEDTPAPVANTTKRIEKLNKPKTEEKPKRTRKTTDKTEDIRKMMAPKRKTKNAN